MVDSLSAREQVLETGPLYGRVVMPYHRMRIRFRDENGDSFPISLVKVRWEAWPARQNKKTPGRRHPSADEDSTKGDRLVATGTSWRVEASVGELTASRVIDTTEGRNETTVELVLRSTR